MKLGKKAFIRTIKLPIVVIAIILLVFLIQNDWDGGDCSKQYDWVLRQIAIL